MTSHRPVAALPGATAAEPARIEREIIVVNDCSTDGTREILARLEREPLPDLQVVHHRRNQGKGAAIRTALTVSSGDYVIIQDADLEYDPADYPRLLAPILAGEAQLVYGVRSFAGQKPLLRWGNQFLTWVTNLLFRTRLHDMETCYKLLPGDLFRTLDLECQSLRHGAGDYGQSAAPRLPHSRGSHQLRAAGREEAVAMARRPAGLVGAAQVPLAKALMPCSFQCALSRLRLSA